MGAQEKGDGTMPTTDKEQESKSRRAIKLLRQVIEVLEADVEHEEAEEHVEKAYAPKERREVKRKKEEEYGEDETFAVPGLDSYPLTKDGKPDEERVRAAWGYIHTAKDRAKLGEEKAKAAEKRIRAFAKQHFPEMELEDAHENMHKALGEVYVFPEARTWPLTKGLVPDEELVRAAWRDLHGTVANHVLGDQADIAERRIRYFAGKHGIALD